MTEDLYIVILNSAIRGRHFPLTELYDGRMATFGSPKEATAAGMDTYIGYKYGFQIFNVSTCFISTKVKEDVMEEKVCENKKCMLYNAKSEQSCAAATPDGGPYAEHCRVMQGGESQKPSCKPVICLDFDGVIHSYRTPWQNEWTISDGPVPGAESAIEAYIEAGFTVAVFSSRSSTEAGIEAMTLWCKEYFPKHYDSLWFPREKPPAVMTIDDRGFQFKGAFPPPEYIKRFRPWNK